MPSHVPLSQAIAPPFAARFRLTHVGIVVFGILAAIFLAWPVWRLAFPLEINRNEAWNAWFIDAVLNGTPLYPSSNELIVNNYPPLSFYVVALVAKFTGDTVYAGRLVALISAGAIAISIALSVRALGGTRGTAALGGLWFLATAAQYFARYVGVNDPNLLALAVMGLALAVFLQRLRGGKPVWPGIVLMVLAGFFKHSLIAIPLAAIIWLLWMNKREALIAVAAGAGLSVLGIFVCIFVYGPNFLEQMLTPRVISAAHLFSTANKLQWVAPALIFWGIWAWPNRRQASARFTALLLAVSLASGLLQACGAGVTINAYLELVFATGIALALAFEGIINTPPAKRFGAALMQAAMLSVLVLRLVLAQQLEPYLILTSAAFREEIRHNLSAMDNEVSRIKTIPGAVSCSNMTVCYRAGKAFVYDGFWVDQMIRTGKLTAEEADKAVRDRGIRFEQIAVEAARQKKRLF